MKTDGRLARCPLKGTRGDAIFAVLCSCGHNLRRILNHIRKLWTLLLAMIIKAIAAAALMKTENARSYSSTTA
jgi:IS5 family transposase